MRVDDFSIRQEQIFSVEIDQSQQPYSLAHFSPNLEKLYIGNSIVYLGLSPIKVVHLPLPALRGPDTNRIKFSLCGTYIATSIVQRIEPGSPSDFRIFQLHKNGTGYTELRTLNIANNKQLDESTQRRFSIENTSNFDMHPVIAELVCLRSSLHSDKAYLEFIDLRTQPPSSFHVPIEPITGLPLSSKFG